MGKIGIFGGAFDPPHIGHLIGAEQARKEFELEKIIFIPTNIPPHKEAPVASQRERLEMTRIAIRGKPYFEVSDIEIKREGISYTIDVIKELKQIYPNSELFLIMGMDEAKDFMNWKEPEKLSMLCKFIILTRPGFKREEIPESLKEKAELFNLNINISSSKIRELIKNSKSIRCLVPEDIENYIKKKKLYL
ncbi:nicotinate-nucleotide adenylyltransferase [candidate division WOR-3 bacterium]|nr:nicotinate-nucleotide adenylyltransferase [candidate division WOR-3 bacterium]